MHKLISSDPSAIQWFQVVSGRVVKAIVLSQSSELFCRSEMYEIALKALVNSKISPPEFTIQLAAATEDDLLAVKSQSPEKTLKIDAMISYLKQSERPVEPPPPLRVVIENASDFQKDTVLQIQHDDSGKLASAVARKI